MDFIHSAAFKIIFVDSSHIPPITYIDYPLNLSISLSGGKETN